MEQRLKLALIHFFASLALLFFLYLYITSQYSHAASTPYSDKIQIPVGMIIMGAVYFLYGLLSLLAYFFSSVGKGIAKTKSINNLDKLASSVDPNDFSSLINLASGYNDTRIFDKAELYLRKAIDLKPKNYAARHTLCSVLIQQGKHNEAYNELHNLLTENADRPDSWLLMGIVLYDNLKRKDEARHCFIEAHNRSEPASGIFLVSSQYLAKY